MSQRMKGKKNHFYGKHHTKEIRTKLSKYWKEFYKKHPKTKLSKEIKRKISETKKRLWKNPLFAEKMFKIWGRRPTNPEKQFMNIIGKYNLPYKYTGDGTFWIRGINPDFVNCNGEKICVEVFGDYWHNRKDNKERDVHNLKVLKKYGWKRIVIWEHELKDINLVLERIEIK